MSSVAVALARLVSLRRGGPPRTLVVAAHPDDETIGAGALLGRIPRCRVLHVTGGAPRDPRFVPRTFTGTTEEYARVRWKELEAALALAGIAPECLLCLNVPDLEAALALPDLARRLAAAFREFEPEVVITHAYEGGHPDHDATAFAVQVAVDLLRYEGREPPVRVEMALYHADPQAGDRVLALHRFLPPPPGSYAPAVRTDLSGRERAVKQRMLACFETQAASLRWFLPPVLERFRVAPVYDFLIPPHEGRLHSERSGFPILGERWRELAREARRELALQSRSSK